MRFLIFFRRDGPSAISRIPRITPDKKYAEFNEVFQKARELSEKEGAEGSEDMANLIRTYNSAREEGWI